VWKNLWKFNVKIIFYCVFLITRRNNKLPRQHGLHVQLSPMKQCDHFSQKNVKMSPICPHTRTQTSLPLSNCSIDDLMVKSGPLLLESFNDVVDVTVDAPDCIVHRVVSRAVWSPLYKGDKWNPEFHNSASLDSLTHTRRVSSWCWRQSQLHGT